MEYKSVVNAIVKPEYKEHIVKQYQGTADIIADLIYCFKLYNSQAKPVSNIMHTGYIKTDGRKIYDFIKNNISYNAEPFTNQTTSSFSRIIHNKKGDCKHSALIVADIGYNMGYNVLFRFASYEKNKNLGHVYTLLQDPKTKEIVIVDPLQSFNYEKPFTAKKDYLAKNLKPNNMALTRLSGMDKIYPSDLLMTNIRNDHYMDGIGKSGKLKAKVKATLKKVTTTVKKDLAKVETPFKKVALAPIRGAFDTLLFFNFRNYAGHLSQTLQNDPAKINTLATTFGYSPQILIKNIQAGAKKKSIGSADTIGIVIPAAVTAAAVAAAPVIIAITPMIKPLLAKVPALVQAHIDHAAQAVKDIAKIPDATPTSTPTDTSTLATGGSQYTKPILITLAAGTVLYFGGKQMGFFGKK